MPVSSIWYLKHVKACDFFCQFVNTLSIDGCRFYILYTRVTFHFLFLYILSIYNRRYFILLITQIDTHAFIDIFLIFILCIDSHRNRILIKNYSKHSYQLISVSVSTKTESTTQIWNQKNTLKLTPLAMAAVHPKAVILLVLIHCSKSL